METSKLIQIIHKNIHLPTILSCDKIEKGRSSDVKYVLTTINGQYIARVSSLENLDKKVEEFDLLKRLGPNFHNISQAIGFIQTEGKVIQVLTYIEGESIEDMIDQITEEDQYQLGLQAGRILLKIHKTPYPFPDRDYPMLEREKIMRRMNMYETSIHKEDQDLACMNYVKNHLSCIANYQVVLCHGDYHIGNLVAQEKNVYVIDFNRFDFEDPIREFVPMLFFSRKKSIAFAKGQLMGYFHGQIPSIFWERLSVYAAYVSMYSILWAEQFSKQDVEGMKEYKRMIYQDFDYFQQKIPNWL
jgi:aminoglycoside phosphotransferase (APT) family kinase protein